MGPIFSRSGQVHLKLGLALGMVDTIPIWPTTELDLDEHGTRFLVFSDGIIEQFNSDGEMYGTDRLLGAFRASLDVDVDAMLRNIIGDLNAFRGDALVKDDLTMIALELIE
jgi:sigma-B regulation protein RsbU (phosphoserine phosphatase)